MKNNKVVVFGGSDLGSHVSDALTDKGYNVLIFDEHQSKYLNDQQSFIKGNRLDIEQVNEV